MTTECNAREFDFQGPWEAGRSPLDSTAGPSLRMPVDSCCGRWKPRPAFFDGSRPASPTTAIPSEWNTPWAN